MMNQPPPGIWMVSPPIAAPQLPRSLWSFVALAALMGALLGSLLTLAADGWIRPALAASIAVAPEWPDRPLPREWRWSPPAVKYEQMFRMRR